MDLSQAVPQPKTIKLQMGGQNRILSKRFWLDQWAAVQVQRVANQWVAWGGTVDSIQTSFKTKSFPQQLWNVVSAFKLRVQIQKEVISDFKRKSQFLSQEF